MKAKQVTVTDYLKAEAKAAWNGADGPALQRLKATLLQSPAVRERLAFEAMAMALKALRSGSNPGKSAVLALCFGDSVSEPRRADYLAGLEQIALRAFGLLGQSMARKDGYSPYEFVLRFALITIRRMDPERFAKVITALKKRMPDGADPELISDILIQANESESGRKRRLRRATEEANHEQIEKERVVRSNLN